MATVMFDSLSEGTCLVQLIAFWPGCQAHFGEHVERKLVFDLHVGVQHALGLVKL